MDENLFRKLYIGEWKAPDRKITYRLSDRYKCKGMAFEIWHRFSSDDEQVNFEMMHPEYERVKEEN